MLASAFSVKSLFPSATTHNIINPTSVTLAHEEWWGSECRRKKKLYTKILLILVLLSLFFSNKGEKKVNGDRMAYSCL